MDARTQAELNAIISALQKVEYGVTKNIKADLSQASKIIVAAVKGRTPISGRTHSRGKGSKRVVYNSGNLQKSIQILPLRRSKLAVFTGPKYGGAKADGYYAGFVNKGTKFQSAQRFIESGRDASQDAALNIAQRLLSRRIDDFKNQNGFR